MKKGTFLLQVLRLKSCKVSLLKRLTT